jgi:hypothetical protein
MKETFMTHLSILIGINVKMKVCMGFDIGTVNLGFAAANVDSDGGGEITSRNSQYQSQQYGREYTQAMATSG